MPPGPDQPAAHRESVTKHSFSLEHCTVSTASEQPSSLNAAERAQHIDAGNDFQPLPAVVTVCTATLIHHHAVIQHAAGSCPAPSVAAVGSFASPAGWCDHVAEAAVS